MVLAMIITAVPDIPIAAGMPAVVGLPAAFGLYEVPTVAHFLGAHAVPGVPTIASVSSVADFHAVE